MGSDDLDDGKHADEEMTSPVAESPTDSSMEKVPVTPFTPPPPVQDGGTRAWLQVAGACLVFSSMPIYSHSSYGICKAR